MAYESKTVEELKKSARKRGIAVGGNKAQLIARLRGKSVPTKRASSTKKKKKTKKVSSTKKKKTTKKKASSTKKKKKTTKKKKATTRRHSSGLRERSSGAPSWTANDFPVGHVYGGYRIITARAASGKRYKRWSKIPAAK